MSAAFLSVHKCTKPCWQDDSIPLKLANPYAFSLLMRCLLLVDDAVEHTLAVNAAEDKSISKTMANQSMTGMAWNSKYFGVEVSRGDLSSVY